MPSNPTLPEDVLRDGHARFHDQPGNMLGAGECPWEGCQFWESATSIAPLIIEWATEQAALVADTEGHTWSGVGATAAFRVAEKIRAQFPTPDETTGGE